MGTHTKWLRRPSDDFLKYQEQRALEALDEAMQQLKTAAAAYVGCGDIRREHECQQIHAAIVSLAKARGQGRCRVGVCTLPDGHNGTHEVKK